MTVNLYNVLPGIGMRSSHIGHQHLINHLAGSGIDYVPVAQSAVREPLIKKFCRNRAGVLPAETDDPDPALANGGRDSCDGILIHSYLTSFEFWV